MTRATYPCELCGQPAASVELVSRGQDAETLEDVPTALRLDLPEHHRLVIRFAGDHIKSIPEEASPQVRRIVEEGAAADLYRENMEWAPFYCPGCNGCYCTEHWDIIPLFDEPGWYDESLGTCPRGHERPMLD